MAAGTHFLNTDLDVITTREPAPLIAALAGHGVHLVGDPETRDGGHWFASFEVALVAATPEATVLAILGAIEELTGEAREIWYVSTVRELNLGFACGTEPSLYTVGLTSSCLARATAAGMSIRITLYPAAAI